MSNLHEVKKLAIIAGSGYLPKHVYDACLDKGVEVILIGLEKETSFDLFKNIKYKKFPIYSISKIVKYMHEQGATHVTLAGKVVRTDIARLLLDIKGAKLFAMIIKNGLNDNAILKTIIQFIEKESFTIIPPEVIATDIVLQKGNITKVKIPTHSLDDIKNGTKILKGIANFDVGQSLIIQNGLVLGVEAAEGTDELIKRCGEIKQKEGEPPILIKISKPKQDRRVDLPCIGPSTVENAHQYGIKGIVAEAGSTLILDQKNTIKIANKLGVFIYGS
jgi:DUF1009 family protein